MAQRSGARDEMRAVAGSVTGDLRASRPRSYCPDRRTMLTAGRVGEQQCEGFDDSRVTGGIDTAGSVADDEVVEVVDDSSS